MANLIAHKKIWITLFALGAIAVLLGAFGAHSLKGKIEPSSLLNYKTAVQYQFVHVLLGICSMILYQNFEQKWFKRAAILAIVGIFLFSGSLYLLTTREISQLGFTYLLGPLTPIGGIFFIGAWLCNVIGINNIDKN